MVNLNVSEEILLVPFCAVMCGLYPTFHDEIATLIKAFYCLMRRTLVPFCFCKCVSPSKAHPRHT